jgi:hypothetical protein
MRKDVLNESRRTFRELTKFDPYEYQVQTMEELMQGNSVIVLAPTGSGKSEAILVPFVGFRKQFLPTQLIYSLPTRTLVDSIADRAKKYAASMKVVAHHGKHAESSVFEEDAVITTIDQTNRCLCLDTVECAIKVRKYICRCSFICFLNFRRDSHIPSEERATSNDGLSAVAPPFKTKSSDSFCNWAAISQSQRKNSIWIGSEKPYFRACSLTFFSESMASGEGFEPPRKRRLPPRTQFFMSG